MTDKLKAYLDGLFSTVPMTDEIKEVKDELYDGMVERYNDCLKEGMEAQDAYDKVIDSIGDIHELFDELIADGTVDFGNGAPDESRDPKQAAESYADAVEENENQDESFKINDFVKSIADFTSGLVSGLFNGTTTGDAKTTPGLELVNSRVLPLEDISSIDISYVSEEVSFTYSENNQLVINEYMNKTNDASLFADITMRNKSIIVKHGRRSTIFGLRSKIEVLIPQAWNGSLSISTVSGGIKSNEIWNLSSFKAKTVSGQINVKEVNANMVRLSSTSGTVYMEKASGSLELNSVSGAVKVEEVAGEGSFATTSGGVRVNFAELKGNVRASSVSGGVRLGLPENASFEFDGKSVSGNIHTAFDHLLTFQKRNKAHGFVGEAPYYNVSTSTTSGGIHVND